MILSYVFNYETLNITNIALLKQRAGHVIIDKNVKLLYNLFLKVILIFSIKINLFLFLGENLHCGLKCNSNTYYGGQLIRKCY